MHKTVIKLTMHTFLWVDKCYEHTLLETVHTKKTVTVTKIAYHTVLRQSYHHFGATKHKSHTKHACFLEYFLCWIQRILLQIHSTVTAHNNTRPINHCYELTNSWQRQTDVAMFAVNNLCT